MTIEITTVKPDPVPVPPDTYTISGLSHLEMRAIRTLLGRVAPASGTSESPTYALFSKLAQADFKPLRTEVEPPAHYLTRFKNNGLED